MSDIQFFDELGAELERVARTGHKKRRLAIGAGALATAAGVLAAIVIVVAAIALVGGHRPRAASDRTHPPVGVKGLVARLAVLRRPQRSEDRLGSASTRLLFVRHVWIDARLTRLATTVNTGGQTDGPVRIYVVIEGQAQNRVPGLRTLQPADSVATLAATGRRPLGQGYPVVAPDVGVTTGGSGANALPSPGDVQRELGVLASIVPDGVTRVKWVFSGYSGDIAPRIKASIVFPTVQNNVAVSRLVKRAGYLSSATWYAADGRVIASFTDATQIAAQESAKRP